MAPNNTLPIWGNEKTMNLNSLILTNIQASPYFKVKLYELKTYHEVIDEIYYKVSHLEPWEKGSRKTAGQTGMCGGVRGVGAGGIVSSAYCLLYKLFTLRLTRKQLAGLLDHADSPYIRGLGFMYIRYTQDPKDLWDWYEPYLDDDEEVDVKAGGGHMVTFGEILRQWLVKLEWYSTLFPRIPVPVQKDIETKMKARNFQQLQQIQQEAPRHIGDDELNFGEAEKYATTAATRRRSPTPPYRSQPHSPVPRRRSPPPRQRSPPPLRHRSPPRRSSPPRRRSPPRRPVSRRSPPRHRDRASPHRHIRSRSPNKKAGSPMDFAKELAREKDRQQNHDRDRRSRSRDKKSSRNPGRRRAPSGSDDDPINFAKNLLREKEMSSRDPKSRSTDRRKLSKNDSDDDDPINFAKQMLREREEKNGSDSHKQSDSANKGGNEEAYEDPFDAIKQIIREKEGFSDDQVGKGNKVDKSKERDQEQRSRSHSKDRQRKPHKEHKRKRSKDREHKKSKKSRLGDKASKHRSSRSRSRERKRDKERRSWSVDRNSH